jgi:uncharacterized protein with HEPN domain
MRQDEATLLDIAQAARLIRVFIGDMAKEDFFDDLKTQSSVGTRRETLRQAQGVLSRHPAFQRTGHRQ